MRLTWIGAFAAAAALACGGGEQAQQQPAAAGGEPAAGAAGPVVEVRMTGDGTTTAAFEPRTLTIAPGTTVRFINVSGGPHNVAFWADSVPAGAAPVLTAAMADQIQPLMGPMITVPNATYEVSFAGAPTGVYKGYCLPHIALGMFIDITVQ